jgi:beta-glucosidase
MSISKQDFDNDFIWGVSTSAYQIEGAYNKDGKGLSIWDDFSNRTRKIKNRDNGNVACDFYHNYKYDIQLLKHLAIENFRMSISWPRVLPEGTGTINQKGLDFYDRVIDECLENSITPWITLYHWDLPLALEKKGGWTNREIVNWFLNYTELCVKKLGDRVSNWMVLNEPMVFTGAGYFLGVHAPGKKGLANFLPAVHHAAICQAQGVKLIKDLQANAHVGSTISCSHITPLRSIEKDVKAAVTVDALLNRLFVEPLIGRGYPFIDLPFLNRIEKFMLPNDEKLLKAPIDFLGIQNYTREVVKYSPFVPILKSKIVKADEREVHRTTMNWEVSPFSIYKMIKKFSAYPEIKKIIVTENGAAFDDVVEGNSINDTSRVKYLERYLHSVQQAKQNGLKVNGYFLWTFLDNFEWAEGYSPRFGIVYNDFKTQQRIVKESGKWYRDFLTTP